MKRPDFAAVLVAGLVLMVLLWIFADLWLH